MDLEQIKKAFSTIFAARPQRVARAPGRVNLIGEHTDYNDGFVLPIAIERQTVALAAARPGRTVRLASLQQPGEPVAVNLDGPQAPGAVKWANYPKGVLAGLLERGVKLIGADILFDSDVPLGGGLSSSASLEVATALALCAVSGAPVPPPRELALLCQQAEHRFANSPCGIMDQSISVMGQPGRALLLDCRDGRTSQIPFEDPRYVLLVADTQVKHSISDGGYAARRDQCRSAADKLRLPSLRDATPQMLAAAQAAGTVAGKELMRARHVVGEIDRTLRAVEALSTGQYGRFGQLMYASHASLKTDYEVSCEELDAVVDIAAAQSGTLGARMTGGGFGGCAIVLASAARAAAVQSAVQEGFVKRFGRLCPMFATRASGGAAMIE
jgi:galactokinase